LDIAEAARLALPGESRTLAYRPRSALPMDPEAIPRDATLLLDTTVYIDGAKRAGLPAPIALLLVDHPIRHSGLCIGELAFGLGGLDPAHGATAGNRSVILDILARISADTVVDLSPEGWARAGVLAGALARMQGFALDRRRALFVDAALFVSAAETGMTLVSGNIADMDLLLQVGGPAPVLLYGQ
jgi:hypothetical protein